MVAPPEPVPAAAGSSWRSAMLVALLAALGRPSTWAVALAGFLVRGGLVVVALPIVVLPSVLGVAIVLAPALAPFVLGETSPMFVALVGLVVGGLTAWVVVGGLIGAWADLALVRAAAADEDFDVRLADRPGGLWRALAVRLIAHLPLAIALAWGATRIVDAAYREVILPDELTTPIVLRVLRDVPDAVTAVIGAWLFGEAVGGLAQRRLWSSEASIPAALGWATARFVRRPVATIGTLVLTTVIVGVAVVIPALVAGVAWRRLHAALAADGPPFEVAVALGLFVCLWLAALLFAGAVTAWRSFAWTAEAFRSDRASEAVPTGGTIGDRDVGRPGEWPTTDVSGSL